MLPDLAEIEPVARNALKSVSDNLQSHLTNVVVHIEEFPDMEIQRDMGLQHSFELLGPYRGGSLGAKSLSDAPQVIDTIYLFRRPLLDYWCETGEDLAHLVRHILIHEIGHHLGFSDKGVARLEKEG